MQVLKCNITQKEWQVKKVCKLAQMPKNAQYLTTIYFETAKGFPYSGRQEIYMNESGYFANLPVNNEYLIK
jgi:hypothetical protein